MFEKYDLAWRMFAIKDNMQREIDKEHVSMSIFCSDDLLYVQEVLSMFIATSYKNRQDILDAMFG